MTRTKGKSTPTKDNLSSKKINAVSSETTSSESTMDDQNFTVVSYSRKARGNAQDETNNGNTLSQSKLSKKFKMAAGWFFGEFQKEIFELIQYVITKNTVQDHPFTLRWINATTGSNKLGPNTSFRAVKRILNLQNIQEYRRFISTAPNIQNYIEFQDRKGDVSGFDYYIKPQFMDEVLTDHKSTEVSQQQSGKPVSTVTPESVQYTSSNDNDADDAIDMNTTLVTKVSSTGYDNEHYGDNDSLTVDTNKKVCYGTAEDIGELLSDIWVPVLEFITKQPDHEHAKQWSKWIRHGLNQKSELGCIKTIIGIDTLDQLFLLLRDSPALQDIYEITWNHKIMYQLKEQKSTDETQILHQQPPHLHDHVPKIYTVTLANENDIEFCILHKLVTDSINTWAGSNSAQPDTKWLQWRQWQHAGLKPLMPTKQLRKILSVTNIKEYIQTLQQYPAFAENFVLYDPIEPDTIRYSYHGPTQTLPTPDDYVHFCTYYEVK
jgi:hypothetical protein